jgi:3-hydroxyacyl-CoA dehydrogenase/enoyl-CoA hydratase/3-hydroxybutyryl-CoA epimerase
VFERIATAKWPSVCAIGGVCLGAGTELALACTARIGADAPEVRIGLPEIRLGLIPGFGGTQRLPRLVGLLPALDLILTGRHVDAREAERLGLLDLVVPGPRLQREAVALLRELPGRAAAKPTRRRRPFGAWIVEQTPPLRHHMLSRVRRKTAAHLSPMEYPAPFRALEAVEAAFAEPLNNGLDLEARIVGDLLPTRTSRNLVELFRDRAALRRDAGAFRAVPRKVRKAAVLGAGSAGSGIAQLLAARGVPVRLRASGIPEMLESLRHARRLIDAAAERERVSMREADLRMAFISATTDSTGFSRADLVVEALEEDLAVRQQALAAVEEQVSERAIVASNTSTLPISEIASQALRPERVIGLHFIDPVDQVPLVEVIAGPKTAPEAVATVHDLAVALGKTPVVVRDAPGFLVGRITMRYVGEAIRLLQEGVPLEAIDAAMKSYGMPTGPFALIDVLGLDVVRRSATILEAAYGKRMGGAASFLGALAEAGATFYRYKNRRRLGASRRIREAAGAAVQKALPVETIQERMVLGMLNEAVLCLEDGVVREPREIDVAVVLAMGFPAFRGGLLRTADAIGLPALLDRLSRLADGHGERFRPAGLLAEMSHAQQLFYRETSAAPAPRR